MVCILCSNVTVLNIAMQLPMYYSYRVPQSGRLKAIFSNEQSCGLDFLAGYSEIKNSKTSKVLRLVV